MNEIWTAVNSETNAAPGSYAMVIDGHGVRIAYTNTDTTLTTEPAALFKAIAPLAPQFRQQITDENLYGNSQVPVTTMSDPALVNQQQAAFQFTPPQEGQTFHAVDVPCKVVPLSSI